ncbi:MAG: cobalamin biosynthesis protein [Syntrophales bacterium LBB04]|nr:cobalamin biosynthesis protein [Syntrophales bacterium LBB04]
MNSEKAPVDTAKTAVITLSNEGAVLGVRLSSILNNPSVFLHTSVEQRFSGIRFDKLLDIASNIFINFRRIIFIGPTGVAVRAFGPRVGHKTTDPAIVAVDVCGRYAISLLSGHEGGANELAVLVANCLGAEPIITTTTEARKNLIVGVGCRKDTQSSSILEAITSTLSEAGLEVSNIRLIASVDIKINESGLIDAAQILGIPLRFIKSEEIRKNHYAFERSERVDAQFGLPAVAEPSAILAGRRTELIVKKKKLKGVTIAVARENCTSSE